MSTQNQTQDGNEAVNEQDDMQAGFSAFADEAQGNEPSTGRNEIEVTDAEVENEQGEEQSTSEQVAELQQEAEKLQADGSLTKAEFDAQIRKVFGKIGELNSKIEAVSRNTPKIKINADKFSRTRESFDDDYASNLASDLSDAVEVEYEAPATQSAEVELTPDQKMHFGIVAGVHPDFKSVIASQEWENFKASLPVDKQIELDNTWDSTVINPMLTKFKAQLTNQKTSQGNKQERLANAITPKGGVVVAKTGLTEQDGFLAASKQFAKEYGIGV